MGWDIAGTSVREPHFEDASRSAKFMIEGFPTLSTNLFPGKAHFCTVLLGLLYYTKDFSLENKGKSFGGRKFEK